MRTITVSDRREWWEGDGLYLDGYSNRYRHYVGKVVDDTTVEVAEFIRPSRGYAKHIRRRKAFV